MRQKNEARNIPCKFLSRKFSRTLKSLNAIRIISMNITQSPTIRTIFENLIKEMSPLEERHFHELFYLKPNNKQSVCSILIFYLLIRMISLIYHVFCPFVENLLDYLLSMVYFLKKKHVILWQACFPPLYID